MRPLPAAGVAALALVAAGASFAACGSSSGTSVDSTKLSHTISVDLGTRYSIAAPPVTCPAGVANVKGTLLTCHATIAGQDLKLNGVVDKPDQVNWQPAASVISLANTANAIDSQFGPQLATALHAYCGASDLKVVPVGGTFTCTALVRGATRQFRVTASDLRGNVGVSLLPPAQGPGATTPPSTLAPTQGSVPSGTLPGD